MAYQTITAATEIGKLREGVVVLRLLQAHGINQLVRRDFQAGTLLECTTIERMIEDAQKSAGR